MRTGAHFVSEISVAIGIERRVHNHRHIQPISTSQARRIAKSTLSLLSHTKATPTSVAVELVIAFMVVVVPLSAVHAGVFTLFAGTQVSAATQPDVIKTDSILDTPVLTATLNPEPQSRGGAEILVADGVLVSSGPVEGDDVLSSHHTGEISVYTVRAGDSLSLIAEMFGVTTNTILWANDLANAQAIKPGQTLIILPIAGVRHVVKAGDTVAGIAKKYESDANEIISFNQLTAGTALVPGATLIIPGGEIHTPAPVKKVVAPTKTSSQSGLATGGKSTSSFVNPIPGGVRTQGIHGYNGVDLGAPIGTPVRAAAAGDVILAKSGAWNGGYGNYIVIKHSNGVQTLYAHLSSIAVSAGDRVAAGAVIGASGNSGKSTGPHLHYEVRGAANNMAK